ncbi:malto-oligosyltrehalose trehalohydrolase [Pedobacter mucosus]|uniref:malto-oligosyltrehalose trehalohydrolase n=1 Tax=Pedobacter mucosus TaxID=2895286 RepID=UPI001EE4A3A9|nr:malto-oligosyltrehalose trehalohydrolase [Pedobacter mucosus]UKT65686.1 malto-oligosyltrehalose trehalohydrolase [Pedobacter mucosus]
MQINLLEKKIGLNFSETGLAIIWFWAPYAQSVSIIIKKTNQRIAMASQPNGYWFVETNQIKKADQYSFELTSVNSENEIDLFIMADPASISQPNGVHASSEAVDLKEFKWTDDGWQAIKLKDLIIYELHVGTFSSLGTFKSVEEKLDYLISLGINSIEIMPVAQFPGERNWGYDGVFPFAVQNSYGGPIALQHLVNTCHDKGLSVILDVVYNHMGPEGNYFNDFGPYFTDKYKTPWGKAINFDDADSDAVRHYFIENVLMWFRDFHIDALRMDAVHAIFDLGAVHILAEIKEYVNQLSKLTGKEYQLIAELDLNDNKFINPVEKGGYNLNAQWVDEFHHALRVASGQEKTGYYADFNGVEHLCKSYQDAYVYDGQYSPHRKKTFGKKAEGNKGEQFVVFSQNHDQIGNRMLGERTSKLLSFAMLKVLAGAVFVSPFIPLIFMGEEYGEDNPFQFFTSHSDPDLIEAVKKGRKAEFAAFHSIDQPPDPQDEATYLNSKLNWSLIKSGHHLVLLNYYKALIAIRKTNSALSNLVRENVSAKAFTDQNCLILHRWFENQQIICLLNFSHHDQTLQTDATTEWINIFNSSSTEWNGVNTKIPSIDLEGKINISPESILIFSN